MINLRVSREINELASHSGPFARALGTGSRFPRNRAAFFPGIQIARVRRRRRKRSRQETPSDFPRTSVRKIRTGSRRSRAKLGAMRRNGEQAERASGTQRIDTSLFSVRRHRYDTEKTMESGPRKWRWLDNGRDRRTVRRRAYFRDGILHHGSCKWCKRMFPTKISRELTLSNRTDFHWKCSIFSSEARTTFSRMDLTGSRTYIRGERYSHQTSTFPVSNQSATERPLWVAKG